MKALVAVVGLIIICVIWWDAFETIILPRRVTRRLRLTVLLYRVMWSSWSAVAKRLRRGKRREAYLSLFGPLSLIVLLTTWAAGQILGFALLNWALGIKINVPEVETNFGSYLYMSGVTFFTLGFGDVIPVRALGRLLTVLEAGTGFGFLAIVIGYLPVIYQAFSRREVNISLLDARAGTPGTAVEMLRRHGRSGSMAELNHLLAEWERWSSDLMESHLSYPVLAYYRSQHDNQSWLAALTTILDTCALVIVGVDGAPGWQAQLTFAMARHAVVDIAQIFNASPEKREVNRV
ncbi:MAG TPA: potassium channel family protein, partial [Pyrinomonadaceae bacterium]